MEEEGWCKDGKSGWFCCDVEDEEFSMWFIFLVSMLLFCKDCVIVEVLVVGVWEWVELLIVW